MSRSLVSTMVIAALALYAVAVTAEAAPIPTTYVYGNLGTIATQVTSNSIGYLNGVQNNASSAQGFSVGSSAWELRSIQLGLANGDADLPSPAVQLFTNGSNEPGSLIATLSGPVGGQPVTSKSLYTFSGTVTLSPNTDYWIVLSDTSAASTQSGYEWYADDAFTTPAEKNSSGITYLGTKAQAFTNGAWTNTVPSLSLEVNAVAVPEPPTYALAMVAGVLGAGAAARKRHKGDKAAASAS